MDSGRMERLGSSDRLRNHLDVEAPSTSSQPEDSGMTSGLIKFSKKGLKTLRKMRIPFKAPSLIDKSRPYFSGVARFGVAGFWNLVNDPFHTLLNLTWGKFIVVFFATYMIEFLAFAFLFYIQGSTCVVNMDGKFAHALWMSSRTASTLGFDVIHPNPECAFINFCVMLEVIFSSLINFIMLGIVFARFSAPFKRANTVRFSKTAVCHSHPSGYWCISLRVANLRKHQILQPSIRMVVTAIDSITPSNYLFEHLKLENAYQQETNVELGFPANLVHVISPDSFLYNLSLLEMDTRMMEVLVFVDGIDAMTSKYMSARTAYSTSEIILNQMHVPLNLEMRGKKLGLDFNDFDKSVPASTALATELELRESIGAAAMASANVAAAAAGAEATSAAGWQLRHQTFRRLAERYGGKSGSSNGHGGSSSNGGPVQPMQEQAAGSQEQQQQHTSEKQQQQQQPSAAFIKKALIADYVEVCVGGNGNVPPSPRSASASAGGMPPPYQPPPLHGGHGHRSWGSAGGHPLESMTLPQSTPVPTNPHIWDPSVSGLAPYAVSQPPANAGSDSSALPPYAPYAAAAPGNSLQPYTTAAAMPNSLAPYPAAAAVPSSLTPYAGMDVHGGGVGSAAGGVGSQPLPVSSSAKEAAPRGNPFEVHFD